MKKELDLEKDVFKLSKPESEVVRILQSICEQLQSCIKILEENEAVFRGEGIKRCLETQAMLDTF